jgi:hypothetical protein
MSEKKSCPACGESVRSEARFCCFCEHEFASAREPIESLPAGPDLNASLTRVGIFLMALGILVILATALRIFF